MRLCVGKTTRKGGNFVNDNKQRDMRIVIAGAGEVGSHLARMLGEGNHDITVIDSDSKLLEDVAGTTDVVTVEGDCTTFATLKKASVRKADLFIAVNHEESPNIISAMLAKQLGARKTIARIDNNEYLEANNKEVFIDIGIDYLFYPEKIAAQEVVNHFTENQTNFAGWSTAWYIFAAYALVVALLFAVVFKEKKEVRN